MYLAPSLTKVMYGRLQQDKGLWYLLVLLFLLSNMMLTKLNYPTKKTSLDGGLHAGQLVTVCLNIHTYIHVVHHTCNRMVPRLS